MSGPENSGPQNFIEKLAKWKLVAYFLLLWAGVFFFNAIGNLVFDAQYPHWYGSAVSLYILSDLASLGAAAMLAFIAWKILQEK